MRAPLGPIRYASTEFAVALLVIVNTALTPWDPEAEAVEGTDWAWAAAGTISTSSTAVVTNARVAGRLMAAVRPGTPFIGLRQRMPPPRPPARLGPTPGSP